MHYLMAALLIIIAAPLLFTVRYRRKIRSFTEPLPFELSDDIADKLKEAVSIRTVTHSDYGQNRMDEFKKIIPFIKKNYPLVSSRLEMENLSDYGFYIRWPGIDGTKKPVLLIAHYDVVPVVDEEWTCPPFDGVEKDGFIWGRGTLDTKNTMTAILESAEQLLARDFTPEQTVYMAFGGDEETQGTEGAGKISRRFEESGLEFDWLLDEGGVVAENALSMVSRPLALVGISEKGYANIRITSRGTGGHSSMPPEHSAAGIAAAAAVRVENNPFPSRLTPTVRAFLRGIVPYVSFPVAVILANYRVFSPLIKKLLLQSPQTAALVRTTQAITILRSGSKENVLPSRGEAIVNLRILPGETVDSVLFRTRNLLKRFPVDVDLLNGEDCNDPINESPMEGAAYSLIQSVIGGVFPEAVTVPYMMTGATDSKHYKKVCPGIYRFAPMSLKSEEIALIHSSDERISRENYRRAIQFYMTLINRL